MTGEKPTNKASDILVRASRSQHRSTYTPKDRGWRYETGVFRHGNFDDEPGPRSIWDMKDDDYSNGWIARTQTPKKGKGKAVQQGNEQDNGDESAGEEEQGSDVEMAEGIEVDDGKAKGKGKEKQRASPKKAKKLKATASPKSRAESVELFSAVPDPSSPNGTQWKKTGFIVNLKAPANKVSSVLNSPHRPKSYISPSASPKTRVMPFQVPSGVATRIAPFERVWKDGTRDYDPAKVFQSLRSKDACTEELPGTYTWFKGAVPVDAIFPPGVPITAKEINAFYPHHVRWKGVSLRLLRNGFQSKDILGMQAYFRDTTPPIAPSALSQAIRSVHRTRNSASFTLSNLPKSTKNLFTDAYESNKLVTDRGMFVPTFAQLVRGLVYLPAGLDARELTVCLKWWLSNRCMFDPPLEFNVLHTRALSQALRIPLRSYGTRNLDKIGLAEFRDKNITSVKIEEVMCVREQLGNSHKGEKVEAEMEEGGKLVVNVRTGKVVATVSLKLRHVFLLPMVAMQNFVGEAFQMGVRTAEQRKALRIKRSVEEMEKTEEIKEMVEREETMETEEMQEAKENMQKVKEKQNQPRRRLDFRAQAVLDTLNSDSEDNHDSQSNHDQDDTDDGDWMPSPTKAYRQDVDPAGILKKTFVNAKEQDRISKAMKEAKIADTIDASNKSTSIVVPQKRPLEDSD